MNCPTTSRGSIAATITATIPQNSRAGTYTGMGLDINVHDQWAVESQGRIHDRTREYLASSDMAIVAYRRLLLKAIRQAVRGERPLMPRRSGCTARSLSMASARAR